MKVFIVFALLFVASSAFKIKLCSKEKSSAVVDLTKVTVTGCEGKNPFCIFKKGQNATLSLPFTPKTPANAVKAVVHGIIANIPIPFSLPNPDGCKNSGLSCPLKANAPVVYTASLPIKEIYPKLRVGVKWELKDEHGVDIVCLMINVKIA